MSGLRDDGRIDTLCDAQAPPAQPSAIPRRRLRARGRSTHLLLVLERLDAALNLLHREERQLALEPRREVLLLLLQIVRSRDLIVNVALLLLDHAALGLGLVEAGLGDRHLCRKEYMEARARSADGSGRREAWLEGGGSVAHGVSLRGQSRERRGSS